MKLEYLCACRHEVKVVTTKYKIFFPHYCLDTLPEVTGFLS